MLHARNAIRAQEAVEKVPDAEKILIADLSSIEETKQLAHEVNALGRFDAVIHNAGVYQASSKMIFAVNTLAPYLLTCLIQKPKRLIYVSSGMHMHGDPTFKNFSLEQNGISYSDSKLHVVVLAKAVARLWPDVYSNAIDPGWVPTKMGGAGAPDNLDKGVETQTWLAVSNDVQAKVSGHYLYHQREARYRKEADDSVVQDKFLTLSQQITGVSFPTSA